MRRWLLALRRDPEFLRGLARDYGDVVRVSLGRRQVVFVNHPAAIREVFVTQHQHLVKGHAHARAREWLGNGLLLSEGAEQRQQRRCLQPVFQPQAVREHADLIVAETRRCCNQWQDGVARNIAEDMLRLALAVVVKAFVRADIAAADLATMHTALKHLAPAFTARPWPGTALLARVPHTAQQQRYTLRTALDEVVERLIDLPRPRGNAPPTLLGHLRTTSIAGVPLTRAQIRAQLLTLLVAGRETVAAALAWAWYLLAQHPEIEEQLHAELGHVLGERPPQAADVASLVYTRMVFAETLRLYPPAWSTGRHTTAPCVVAGATIPPESVVLMSQYVLHRDPRYYPNPDQFDPQRWTPAAQAARPKLAYFPFGAGPRRCIGEAFAWTEGILVLASIAQRWRLRLVPGQAVTPAPLTSLQPRPALAMVPLRRAA